MEKSFQDSSCEEDRVLCVLQSSPYPHEIQHWHGAVRQHFSIVDSTQIQAGSLINVLPQDRWLILSAEEQTAGRGSHNRRWASPPRVNLYVTFVLPFPKKSSEKLFFVSQVANIAVARTVKKFGFDPEIKWPNDLMLNKKKVSGILSENKTLDGAADYSALLIGIGLNVNMDKSVGESLDQPVTSLSVEANRLFEKEEILPFLYQDLKECIGQLLEKGFSDFHHELNSMLAFKGETIIVDRDVGEPLQGIFVGIDEMGRMKLQVTQDKIISIQDGRIRKRS